MKQMQGAQIDGRNVTLDFATPRDNSGGDRGGRGGRGRGGRGSFGQYILTCFKIVISCACNF